MKLKNEHYIVDRVCVGDNRFFALDGLRSIAFYMVLAVHSLYCMRAFFDSSQSYYEYILGLPVLIRNFLLHGDYALDLFFVLSAFLLGSQLFSTLKSRSKIDYRWYYIKRVLRIYPIYCVALLVFGLISILVGDENYKMIWANLLGINNLLGLENIFMVWTWSISAEIQFYFICPLLVLLAYHKPKIFFLSMVLVIAASLWWRYHYLINGFLSDKQATPVDFLMQNNKQGAEYFFDNIYMHPLSRISAFLLGLIAAYVVVIKERWINQVLSNQSVSLFLSIVSIGLIFYVVFATSARYLTAEQLTREQIWGIYYFESVASRAIFSLGIAMLIVLLVFNAFGLKAIDKGLSIKPFYLVSQTSYSMYLFHPLFLLPPFVLWKALGLMSAPGWIEPVWISVIVTFVSLIFGVLMYNFIEHRFLRGAVKQWVREQYNRA